MSRNQSRRGGGGGCNNRDKQTNNINNSRQKNKRDRPDEWLADARDVETLHSDAFDVYYKNHVVPHAEWDEFIGTLHRSLPMALRVNHTSPCAEQLNEYVFNKFSDVFNTIKLKFYEPHDFAFQCTTSRGELKRNSMYKSLKKLITALNDGGYVSRQETVSMIPAVLLNVQPGDRVLDMCAAPGSKTTQILEMLISHIHRNTSSCNMGNNYLNESLQRGVLVANDVNTSRLDVLTHQTNRIAHGHPHLIITSYDASKFPNLVLPQEKHNEPLHELEEHQETNNEHCEYCEPRSLRFDRVLCDVVCSGDGTLRKSLDLWSRWNTLLGVDLHKTQCAILSRGMELCKENGVVVYSTCSLNPVEDEAVLLTCLQGAEGCFELIDVRPMLKGFRSVDGLASWHVMTRDLQHTFTTYADACNFYTSCMSENEEQTEDKQKENSEKMESQHKSSEEEECVQHENSINANTEMEEKQLQEEQKKAMTTRNHGRQPKRRYQEYKFVESMFAPGQEIAERFNIHYARRILPHHEDTGGFFVAALKCVKELPCNKSMKSAANTSRKHQQESKVPKNVNEDNHRNKNNNNPCIAAPLRGLTAEMRSTVQGALSLPDSFPFHQLLYRNDYTRVQKIYYACDAVLELMPYLGPRISHAGAKVFESYVKHSNDKLRYWPDGVRNLVPLLLQQQQEQEENYEECVNQEMEKLPLTPLQHFVVVTPSELLQIALAKDALTKGKLNDIVFSVKDAKIKNNNEKDAVNTEQKTCSATHPSNNSHCFILTCDTTKFGNLYVACECRTNDKVEVHIAEWQITLCKEECNLPLIEQSAAENEINGQSEELSITNNTRTL